MPDSEMDLDVAAARVGALFARIQDTLAGWREAVLADTPERPTTAALDATVAAFVLPELDDPGALVIGAGFIAAPELTGADAVHFSWWLGPLDENPVYGATTGPTKLDLGTRSYTDYLRDFRSLEWYRVPQSTHRTHVTGPYVDHLCTCDYIVTVTAPVEREGRMIGVVGVDVFVKRLERELLPSLLATRTPLVLVNDDGRVLVSTDPAVLPGAVHAEARSPRAVPCPGTPFRLVPTTTLE
ncbi:cache domain-containing protein [Leifsonia sp. NPDC058194]|uniref:cache domain-containing protein n=1 Tax=Leifsonia sp. NPDC058194 TaxID=3346374 RepID=UPI0036D92FF7